MTTPIKLGIANISRLPIMVSMRGAPRRAKGARIADGEWRMDDCARGLSLFATPYSLFAIRHSIRHSPHSPLHQRAIVEPAVEPVLISRDVLLHRDVDEGLIQRDAQDIAEGKVDEALHVGVVGRLVAARRRGARTVD